MIKSGQAERLKAMASSRCKGSSVNVSINFMANLLADSLVHLSVACSLKLTAY